MFAFLLLVFVFFSAGFAALSVGVAFASVGFCLLLLVSAFLMVSILILHHPPLGMEMDGHLVGKWNACMGGVFCTCYAYMLSLPVRPTADFRAPRLDFLRSIHVAGSTENDL